jgi:hypothetical protein
MSKNTDLYFKNMTEGIPVENTEEWEQEIARAEEQHCFNPAMMDILATRKVNLGSESDVAAIGLQSVTSQADKWIQLALSVEAQQ